MDKLEFVIAPKLAEGQLISSVTKSEVLECAAFCWETRLTPEEGEVLVKSPIYQVGIPEVTRWQIELDPNYVDAQGTRHLSLFVRLVESEKEEFTAFFGAHLQTGGDDYFKEGGLYNFSKDVPRYGFQKYIEMYRLQSNGGNPLGDRFRFKVDLKLFAELQPVLDLLNPRDYREPFDAPPEPYSPILYKDAHLRLHGLMLPVDSTRLSFYSSFFRQRFRELASIGMIVNVDKYFATKCMAERVIEFCHEGKLVNGAPKRPQGFSNMMKAAEKLGIPLLKEECQRKYLEELKPKYFVETVELVRSKVLDEKETMPVLMDYLLKNFNVIRESIAYGETYPQYKDLYRRYLFEAKANKPSEEREGVAVASPSSPEPFSSPFSYIN